MRSKTPVKTALRAVLVASIISHAAAQTAPKLEWIKPSLVGVPPPRTSTSMVYDPAMGATLLLGGNTYNALFGDTWAFSKTKGWTQLTPAVSPPPLQCVDRLRPGDKNHCAFRRLPRTHRREYDRLGRNVDVGRGDLDSTASAGLASGAKVKCWQRIGL
jgi:hypothetical protein